MNKKTTIYDIARELNTTISTVSRALNNHPGISISTKEAVQKTADRLNYRQNKVASALRSGRTHIIGVIIPSAELNFFGSVVHGIEQVMNQNGYNVLLYQSNESYDHEKKGIETFIQSNVDGIIASISLETTNFDHFHELKKRNIPLIIFDRANDELDVPAVTIHDYQGGYMATEHLIKQGFKNIAHISAQRHIKIFNDRLRGYTDALKDYNLPVHDDLIVYGKVSIESGRECTRELLQRSVKPGAIFGVEDFTALGAMQELKSQGLRIPQDVGLIGFANESFSAYITPALSTIDQQTKKMGEEAANLFLELWENKGVTMPSHKVVLEPMLVVRESSVKS